MNGTETHAVGSEYLRDKEYRVMLSGAEICLITACLEMVASNSNSDSEREKRICKDLEDVHNKIVDQVNNQAEIGGGV